MSITKQKTIGIFDQTVCFSDIKEHLEEPAQKKLISSVSVINSSLCSTFRMLVSKLLGLCRPATELLDHRRRDGHEVTQKPWT